jgi:NAD(P)-dependent dehydrogenase (short-subunit alcohol dehydrogenase family)
MANSYVILGAYGGIGSARARRLAGAGHRLFLAGRDQTRLQGLALSAAATYASRNLHVNCVAPGSERTDPGHSDFSF